MTSTPKNRPPVPMAALLNPKTRAERRARKAEIRKFIKENK